MHSAGSNVPGHLAIIGYRSLVGGIPSRSLDIQVRWFAEADAERVRHLIQAEPFHRYRNPGGEKVCWELVEVFAVEPFAPSQSGEEVVGFIASVDELKALT